MYATKLIIPLITGAWAAVCFFAVTSGVHAYTVHTSTYTHSVVETSVSAQSGGGTSEAHVEYSISYRGPDGSFATSSSWHTSNDNAAMPTVAHDQRRPELPARSRAEYRSLLESILTRLQSYVDTMH